MHVHVYMCGSGCVADLAEAQEGPPASTFRNFEGPQATTQQDDTGNATLLGTPAEASSMHI